MNRAIALDVSSAARPEATGVATYIRRLVAALARQAPERPFLLFTRLSRWRQRAHFVRPPASNFKSRFLLEPCHPFLARRLDLFHGLDARLPGAWLRAPLVATLHDLYSVLQSESFAPAEFRELKTRRYRDLAARADRLIVVSEACRRDVLELLRPDPARIRVIPEAAGDEFRLCAPEEVREALQRHGLERPYLLYVGSLNRRKNVSAMVRAFTRARARAHSDAILVIAGRAGFGAAEIQAELAAAGAEGLVKWLGYVPAEALPPLYAGAWGLLFVTHYEGFGIPVVEAFRCGCPVLGGTAGSVPEVAGGAALLADPRREDEIAARIEELLTDEGLRAELRRRGLERAKDFSWERTARETLAVYRELSR